MPKSASSAGCLRSDRIRGANQDAALVHPVADDLPLFIAERFARRIGEQNVGTLQPIARELGEVHRHVTFAFPAECESHRPLIAATIPGSALPCAKCRCRRACWFWDRAPVRARSSHCDRNVRADRNPRRKHKRAGRHTNRVRLNRNQQKDHQRQRPAIACRQSDCGCVVLLLM